MRLLSLQLKGQYKGLKDQGFDFHNAQGSVVALIGLNGSGKSQLLELIAEIFAFLERAQRRDFEVKTPLGFGFELKYSIGKLEDSDGFSFDPTSEAQSNVPHITLTNIYKIKLSEHSKEPKAYIWLNEVWDIVATNIVRLPYVVGYSSGLNENMQRSFMKNAVQYFEIQRIRQKHSKERSGQLDELQHAEMDERYLNKYPHIFEGEADTPISKAVYLDYDSASLMVACLSVLPSSEVNDILEELNFKSTEKFTLRYDFRGGVVEQGAIRDIKMLIRASGDGGYRGDGRKSSEEEYNLYELDYLSGYIDFDLLSDKVISSLREANYDDPLVLFSRLYKIQQLGMKNLRYPSRLLLKNDNFLGTVKKPLKTRLPLSVFELMLSDDQGRNVCFDDLSDGEAQLMQILATTKIFSSDNTIFLYDEPETHLNPAWRTYFHSHLSSAISDSDGTNISQVFLSTHSPFMLSSLKREDVLVFERDESGKIDMQPVDSQTFGSSFDVLIKKYFGLRSLISQTAVEETKKHLPTEGGENTRESAFAWIEENLGESMEKAYLLRKLKA